jgi:hypothetical protein
MFEMISVTVLGSTLGFEGTIPNYKDLAFLLAFPPLLM